VQKMESIEATQLELFQRPRTSVRWTVLTCNSNL
jgi:hypothetical protein